MKMVNLSPKTKTSNEGCWIIVQEHNDVTRFAGLGPTSSVKGIITQVVNVDKLSELLIKAVNNRTRERNYFKKLVELFQNEITEDEFDREIEEHEDEYVVNTDEKPTREDIILACEAVKRIKDVKDVYDFSALFSFNQESIIKELEAK